MLTTQYVGLELIVYITPSLFELFYLYELVSVIDDKTMYLEQFRSKDIRWKKSAAYKEVISLLLDLHAGHAGHDIHVLPLLISSTT